MFGIDSLSYTKLGLLIGLHNTQLGLQLMECDSLEEVGTLINKTLGTDIVRGMLLPVVLEKVEEAIKKQKE